MLPWQAALPTEVDAASLPFSVTRAALRPSTVTAGQAVGIEARVQARVAGAAIVEATIADGAGEVAWQETWPEQSFRSWQTRTYATAWETPATQPGGRYTLTVRVLGGDGAELSQSRSAALTVKAAAPAPPPTPEPTPDGSLEPEEAAFLALINQYRQSRGLAPLAINPNLTAAAEWMSQDMAAKGYFSHTDSLGRDPFQRMAAFGYTANTWKGENIAAGYQTAAQVMAGWQSSAGHNANMLNGNVTVIGIGRAYKAGSPYGHYWTTTFGGQ
jgi:uncharacterized protein YkwD